MMESLIYVVKSKRCYTVIKVEGNNFEVLDCSNMEKCRSMGILKCPPFCDKITALKNYLRFGHCKYEVELR